MRWLVVLVLGCGTPAGHPADPPKPPDGSGSATGSGSSASPTAPTSIDRAPTDPPEPVEPAAECVFARSVFCVPAGAASALPAPFDRCAATQTARKSSVVPGDAKFSANETRGHRQDEPGVCCYAEFSTLACR